MTIKKKTEKVFYLEEYIFNQSGNKQQIHILQSNNF